MSNPTSQQQLAIRAEGDVAVMAGAGTGKTRTLVERCLDRLLASAEPVSLEEMLLVTFTDAAAAEMRQRIRQRLDAETVRQLDNQWLAEQLALVDTAWICTLHSFCLGLVREHFHELALDPAIAVLDEAQGRVLAAETLDRLLQRHYAGTDQVDQDIRDLILAYGSRDDEPVRRLVLRVHDYTQTLPEPELWLQTQLHATRQSAVARWSEWLLEGLAAWRAAWRQNLRALGPDNPNAVCCLELLERMFEPLTRPAAAETLQQVKATDQHWPTRRKGILRKPMEELYAEVEFWLGLLPMGAEADPLAQDWEWVRPRLAALLELVREFASRFASAKRELGLVDFHDLEQLALQLLWDRHANRSSVIAGRLRRRLKLVFVDEYQDINAAQARIIQAVSRTGAAANRFLVGDIKQSIYRFRLADPRIFQACVQDWGAEPWRGQVIHLSDNFRSHEGILRFANALFGGLMQREVGGVEYDAQAALQFGNREQRLGLAMAPEAAGPPAEPRVELMLRLTSRQTSAEAEADHLAAGRSNTEQEALWLARRLRELKDQCFLVWDTEAGAFRPVNWSDMVILLRSPRGKAETYAKVFHRAGIPLVARRRGLYKALEVSDLLSLLMLLDNPLQDVPALAVLRAPLANFTLDELALIRLQRRKGNFWIALERFHRLRDPGRHRLPEASEPAAATPDGPDEVPETEARLQPTDGDEAALAALAASAWRKADLFLARFQRWRDLARRSTLSRCLETVLDETHYEDWLLTQERGSQRRANVQRLLTITRQFDRFQRVGLGRFLKFVEAQQEVEYDPEPASVQAEEAVRLMSIHQSKGLEFPVVAVADLGKPWNLGDLNADIILDEEYGLCLVVRPPWRRRSYPSLPHWLAARRQRRELLGEELRLLYVAMTRACDKLLLAGTTSRRAAEEKWPRVSADHLTAGQVSQARHALDWLGPLISQVTGCADWLAQPAGQSPLLSWRVHEGAIQEPPAPVEQTSCAGEAEVASDALEDLKRRLAWEYPHPAATREPAKTSVTGLRRRVLEETDEESRWAFGARSFGRSTGGAAATPEAPRRLSASEVGTAYHRFLQFVSLDRACGGAELAGEAEQLCRQGFLTPEEAAAVDVTAVAAFWNSPLGQRILGRAEWVRRELPFTARFAPEDLQELALTGTAGLAADEFVIVQGVADLVVIQPEEIWLVDFKSDQVGEGELGDRCRSYAPQLSLYALALQRIYQRPVTEAWLHFLALRRSVPVELVRC